MLDPRYCMLDRPSLFFYLVEKVAMHKAGAQHVMD